MALLTFTSDSKKSIKSKFEEYQEQNIKKSFESRLISKNAYAFLPFTSVGNRSIMRGVVDGDPSSPFFGFIGQLSGGVIGDDPLIPLGRVKDYKLSTLNVLDLQIFTEGGQILGTIPATTADYTITADFSFDAYYSITLVSQDASNGFGIENLILPKIGTVNIQYDSSSDLLSFTWTPINQTISLINNDNLAIKDFLNKPTVLTNQEIDKVIEGEKTLFGSIRMPSINIGSTAPYPILTNDQSTCIEKLFENKWVSLSTSLILKYGGNFANFTPKKTLTIS